MEKYCLDSVFVYLGYQKQNYGSEKPFHDNGVLGSSCTEHVLTRKLWSLPATLFCGTAAAYCHIMHCQKPQLSIAHCSCIAQARGEQPAEVHPPGSAQQHTGRRAWADLFSRASLLGQRTANRTALQPAPSVRAFIRDVLLQKFCHTGGMVSLVCCAYHTIRKTQGSNSVPHASTGRSKILMTHWIQNLSSAYSNKQKAMLVAGKHNHHIYTYSLALAFTHNCLLAVAF